PLRSIPYGNVDRDYTTSKEVWKKVSSENADWIRNSTIAFCQRFQQLLLAWRRVIAVRKVWMISCEKQARKLVRCPRFVLFSNTLYEVIRIALGHIHSSAI